MTVKGADADVLRPPPFIARKQAKLQRNDIDDVLENVTIKGADANVLRPLP